MIKTNSKILYFFISIIVIAAILIFLFKDDLAHYFLPYNASVNYSPPSSSYNTNNNNLGLDILRDKRIKVLDNYIEVFDYEDLDGTQDRLFDIFSSGPQTVITTYEVEVDGVKTSVTTTTPKTFFKVSVGNGNPFASTQSNTQN